MQENKNKEDAVKEPKQEPAPPQTIIYGDAKRQVGKSTELENQYSKLSVQNSPLAGYGVFATEDIKAGSILEEVPFVVWPRSISLSDRLMNAVNEEGFLSEEEKRNEDLRRMFDHKHPTKYYFKWFPPNSPREGKDALFFQCLPLGYGPIYNSSNGKNNATWTVKEKTFIFNAQRDIKAGEEVMTFYGYFMAEDDSTFNVHEVFGLALEYLPTTNGGKEVMLTNIRFAGEQEQQTRVKEEGCQKIITALQESQGLIKLNKISAMDGAEEKHQFEFPPDFPLHYCFRKLQEFKQTRFPMVKLYISYEHNQSKKMIKKEILYVNHNVQGG